MLLHRDRLLAVESAVKSLDHWVVVFRGWLHLSPQEEWLLHVGRDVNQIWGAKWISGGPPEVITYKGERQHQSGGEWGDYSADFERKRWPSFSEYEHRERDQDLNAEKQALIWTTVRKSCQPNSQ